MTMDASALWPVAIVVVWLVLHVVTALNSRNASADPCDREHIPRTAVPQEAGDRQ